MRTWKVGDTEIREDDHGDIEWHHPPTGTTLRWTRAEWRAFIQGVQAGEFSDLADAMTVTYQEDPPPCT